MMKLTNGNPKIIRTIKFNLNKLLKIKNYRLPVDIGECFDTDKIKFRMNNSEIHLLLEKKEDVF